MYALLCFLFYFCDEIKSVELLSSLLFPAYKLGRECTQSENIVLSKRKGRGPKTSQENVHAGVFLLINLDAVDLQPHLK